MKFRIFRIRVSHLATLILFFIPAIVALAAPVQVASVVKGACHAEPCCAGTDCHGPSIRGPPPTPRTGSSPQSAGPAAGTHSRGVL